MIHIDVLHLLPLYGNSNKGLFRCLCRIVSRTLHSTFLYDAPASFFLPAYTPASDIYACLFSKPSFATLGKLGHYSLLSQQVFLKYSNELFF